MFSINIYTCRVNVNIHCHFNCTCQTDLGPRSRIFSLKINELPTFLKSLKPLDVDPTTPNILY